MQKGKTQVDSAFYQDLEEASLSAFWKVIAPLQKGGSPRRGRIWRWDQVHSMLERAGKLVGPDQGAERRVLIFAGAESSATTTPTLTASVQMVLPGETAPSHRHTISAIRFVLSAKGAFTEVEGERIPMEPGDLIVTPAWSWHGHGNESREPAVWLDGLDAPLVRALKVAFFEPDSEQHQKRETPDSGRHTATGSVRALGAHSSQAAFPVVYPWSEVYPELQHQAAGAGDPYDGVIVEYVHPATGGPTLPTLGCYLQLLRPGEKTRTHRHTGSVIYHVVRGSGYSTLEGERIDWQERDTFALPSWVWHAHSNSGSEEAILFSFTEAPALRTLGLYRQEEKSD